MDWSDLTEEQQEMASTFDKNLCVTAGAGTGKTTALTARYMKLFDEELGDMDKSTSVEEPDDLPLRPTEIVATTFTKRAARDLEDSTREEITDRLESATTESEHRYWRAVSRDLDDAYIHTLHSFCSRILREFALESDLVEPGFEVIEGVQQSELIEQTVNQAIESDDEKSRERVSLLSELYGRYQLTSILTDMVKQRPESREWVNEWAGENPEEYTDRALDEFYPVSGEEARDIMSDRELRSSLRNLVRLRENPPDSMDEGDMGAAWDNLTDIVDVVREYGILDGEETGGREAQKVMNKICDILTSGDGNEYGGSQEFRYYGSNNSWVDHPESREVLKEGMSVLLEKLNPSENLVSGGIEGDEAAAPYIIALADLAETTLDSYKEAKSERNLLDNTDLITYALELLNNSEVQQQLNQEIEHVMVDEFQDTDPRQWDIIKALTESVSEKSRNGSESDVFRGENVFVVGDKKQSIYRFRNADVTAFDRTAEAIRRSNQVKSGVGDSESEIPDELSVNFRTLPNTLGFLNVLFDGIFSRGGDAAYEADAQSLSAGRLDPESLLHRPEYVLVPTEEELRDTLCSDSHELVTEQYVDDSDMEAYAVASRIASMLDEQMEVYSEDAPPDDETVESKAVEPGDIAILIRSRTNLKSYERALKEAGVPYSVASGIGFHDTPEVTALKNLFEVLSDPEDDISLYGVLRSPLFGVSDREIAEAYSDRDGSLWENLSEDTVGSDGEESMEKSSVERAVAQIRRWRSRLGLSSGTDRIVESWSGFLTEVIEETGYIGSVAADEREKQAIENVEKFRELVRQFEGDGNVSLSRLLQRIRTHKESDDDEGEAELPEEVTGVEIMTIHDAKGEEFPVVVIPNIDRKFFDKGSVGNGAIEFETVGDVPWLGMKSPDENQPFDEVPTRTRSAIREHRRNEEKAEEKRVLYVASTRARDKLVFVGQHSGEVKDGEDGVTVELDSADPEDPGSWVDWMQPELFPEGLGDTLSESGTDKTILTIDDNDDRYEYEVRLPEEGCPDLSDETETESDPTYEMSPNPQEMTETPTYSYRLTASSIPKILDDRYDQSFSVDRTRKRITKSRETDTEDGLYTSTDELGDGSGSDDIPATLFGDLVHMIAERRPPTEKWKEMIKEVSSRHEVKYTPSEEDVESVIKHAKSACEYVDRETPDEVDMEADEIGVTKELEHGEIKGYIDHIIATPEEYIIIDYKTNDVESAEEVDDLSSYYQPQLDVYASAVVDDTDRDIRTSLYFTSLQEAREEVYTQREAEQKGHKIDGRIWDKLKSRINMTAV